MCRQAQRNHLAHQCRCSWGPKTKNIVFRFKKLDTSNSENTVVRYHFPYLLPDVDNCFLPGRCRCLKGDRWNEAGIQLHDARKYVVSWRSYDFQLLLTNALTKEACRVGSTPASLSLVNTKRRWILPVEVLGKSASLSKINIVEGTCVQDVANFRSNLLSFSFLVFKVTYLICS